MKCFKCQVEISTSCKYLNCSECRNSFHLTCIDSVNQTDYEFIISSSSVWKCDLCKVNRKLISDETPVTPSRDQFDKSKDVVLSDVDSDSSQYKGTGTSRKIVCAKCCKGFSNNAHRAVCTECSSHFHFQNNCAEIIKNEYLKVKDSWLCNACKNRIVRGGKKGSGMATDSAPQQTVDNKQIAGDITLLDLLNEMKSFRAEVSNKHKDFTDNLNKHSDWVAELADKIDNVSKNMSNLASEISLIRQENINLKKQVSELNEKVNYLEQSSKDNVVEIRGVPFIQGENLLNVLSKMSTVIDFEFNENMIDYYYRYKSSPENDSPGGIVVRFVRKIDMLAFMEKRKIKKNLNSRELGFMSGEATVIYVNQSLTQAKRKLLRAARKCKLEKSITYVWVSGGRILIRKNVGDPVIEVKSEEDLVKLK